VPVLNLKQISLVRDQSFLVEKREVLDILVKHLNKVEDALKTEVSKHIELLPHGSLTESGKISRGENYRQLPYLVLDFPRFSSGNKVFMYRTMFWWGNYFLCLLVTENCGYSLIKNTVHNDLMINIGESPWNYDLEDPCWEKLIDQQHPFLSISRMVPFDDIELLPELSKRTFRDIMSLLIK